VEKSALLALQTQPWLKDHPDSIIRTPKLFHFDDDQFVLIMEDAGVSCKTLFTLLSNQSNDLFADNYLETIAREIRIFSDYLSEKSQINAQTHPVFENKPLCELISGHVTALCNEQAKTLNIEQELQPFMNKLSLICKPREGAEVVFVFGDLWANSILINFETNLIWIIDFEMARFETKKRDMAQLMTNLWIMKENPSLFNASRADCLMKRLQLEFLGDENCDWRFMNEKTYEEFPLFILMLCTAAYWGITDKRGTILKAISELKQKSNGTI
jgi:5-methylthioribose kinase